MKNYIYLMRLNKPTGFLLLFWPCSWGMAYNLNFLPISSQWFYYLFLFFAGSILMRSAGCIFNDIVDKDFDKKVKRTKKRPIASGKITIFGSFLYVLFLCLLAFIILIQFNYFTIVLGLSSMLLAFSYPFMKRITYWPQLFLGITFNWGLIMAWTAVTNYISIEGLILYFSAIFWTLGYDTIYGTQDISDDEIIGLKSTAIKFKNNLKIFVTISYIITTVALVYLFHKSFEFNIATFFIFFFILSLFYQIFYFKKDNPETCLESFKLNNYSGLFLFLGIFLRNF